MDVDAEVRLCVQLMTQDSPVDYGGWVQSLVAGGVTEVEAEALIALVPIGFAHAALSNTGVELPRDFVIRNPNTGENVPARLADDAIFQSANRLAHSMLAAQSSRRDALKIVANSSEWATIRRLCPEGVDFDGCVLVETILMRVPLEYLRKN
jgi:hypothetical protein